MPDTETPSPPNGWRQLLPWIVKHPWETFRSLSIVGACIVAIATLVSTITTFKATSQTAEDAERTARIAADGADIARQGLTTERFKNGVEELGNQAENVQAGGIFTLARVANDSAADAANAYEIILFFVRGHLYDRPVLKDGLPSGPPRSVIAGLQVLRAASTNRVDLSNLRCDSSHVPPQGPADLTGVNLSNVDLTKAELSGAALEHADLTNALLRGAIIDGSDFHEANLTNADLTGKPVGFSQAQLLTATWNPQKPPLVDPDKRHWLNR